MEEESLCRGGVTLYTDVVPRPRTALCVNSNAQINPRIQFRRAQPAGFWVWRDLLGALRACLTTARTPPASPSKIRLKPGGCREALRLIVGVPVFALPPIASALELNGIFSDGAVLQREKPLPIWGWAQPGGKVS